MSTLRKLPETFKAHEDGKSRRHSLLFTVNGGAFAVAKLFPAGNPCVLLGKLTLFELSLAMMVFTVLLTLDIFLFGWHMRSTVSNEAMGPSGDTLPIFGTPGQVILVLISLFICLGWFLVGVAKPC